MTTSSTLTVFSFIFGVVTALRKCCPESQAIDLESKSCIGLSLSSNIFNESVEFSHFGFPDCSVNENSPEFRFQSDFRLVSFGGGTYGLHDEFVGPVLKGVDFCVDASIDLDLLIAGVCEAPKKEMCRERPCFSLCDSYGVKKPSPPPIRDKSTGKASKITHDIKYYDDYECNNIALRVDVSEPNVTLYEDGTLSVQNRVFDHDEFCLDLNSDGVTVSYKVCAEDADGDWFDYGETKRKTITYLSLTSCVFYTLAIVIVVVRRKREHLFGVMMLFLIGSLLVVNISYSVIQMTDASWLALHPVACQGFGFTLYFFYISSSCWLACMGVDIYANFRRLRNRPDPVRRKRHFKRYLAVCLAIPTIMSVITLTMHLLPEATTKGLVVPGIGQSRCFIEQAPLPLLLYFHCVNIPCNLIALFSYLCTTYNLCCGVWRQIESEAANRKNNVNAVTLIKLFFVLGVNWGLEELSLILRANGKDSIVLFLCDVCNAGQGVVLCLVVLLDREFADWCRKAVDTSAARAQKTTKQRRRERCDKDAVETLKIRQRDVDNSYSDLQPQSKAATSENRDSKPLWKQLVRCKRTTGEYPVDFV